MSDLHTLFERPDLNEGEPVFYTDDNGTTYPATVLFVLQTASLTWRVDLRLGGPAANPHIHLTGARARSQIRKLSLLEKMAVAAHQRLP